MRGSDLAHLRWLELMPYYPWAVVKLLKKLHYRHSKVDITHRADIEMSEQRLI